MVEVKNSELLSDENREFAVRKLTEFEDSWKRPDDFEDSAILLDVIRRDEEYSITREQQLAESHKEVTRPPEQYDEIAAERSTRELSYDQARETWRDETVEFADPNPEVSTCDDCTGDGIVECMDCTGGLIDCTRCGGSGRESCSCRSMRSPNGRRTCSTCSNSGTVSRDGETETCPDCAGKGHVLCRDCNGAGGYRCTLCNGSEQIDCPECDGTTTVRCERCDGEGELARGLIGTLEFETSEETTIDPTFDVPEMYIERVEGALADRKRSWLGADGSEETQVIRRERERRSVPVRKITYEYGSNEWALFDIGGLPWAEAYPESQSRRVVPYLLLVVLLVLASVGIYLLL